MLSHTVVFRGELTINQLPEIVTDIMDALKKWHEVTVDISKVEKVDLAVIQMFIAVEKECNRNGMGLTFNLSDEIVNFTTRLGIRL